MAYQEAVSNTDADGENYFISMTDMMVGMLFIFIILLMSFALLFRHHWRLRTRTPLGAYERANVENDHDPAVAQDRGPRDSADARNLRSQ